MKPAMKARPYLLNKDPLPAGYWQDFYAGPVEGWTPPEVSVERKSGRLGDILGWVGGVPLFSKAAMELLKEVGHPSLQFVPFGDVKEVPYWLMARIPTVSDLSFESMADAGAVFCLPGDEIVSVVVKEIVPASVVSRKLKGFEFRSPDEPHLRALFMGEGLNVYPGVNP